MFIICSSFVTSTIESLDCLPRDANGRDGAGVQSAAKPEHAVGLAAARYIQAHHQRFVLEVERLAILRREDPVGVDVLEVRSAWGNAEHADPEEVAILAVVDAPLLDQFFIREPALAAVDGAVVPTIPQGAESDLVKPAIGPAGLAPGEKHGLAVGEAAKGHIPDGVRDVGCFVEQVPGGGILGVLAREGLSVFLAACLHDHFPVFGALLRIDARLPDVEPMCRDA